MRFKILDMKKSDAHEEIDWHLEYSGKIVIIDMTKSKDCRDLKEEVWYETETIKLKEDGKN